MQARPYKPGSERNPAGLICPRCGSGHLRRIKREGFFQLKFWTHFGMYPWECGQCRKTTLFRCRGERKHKRSATAQEPV